MAEPMQPGAARLAATLAPFDLSGRVAVVTGAGSGLGRHFASALAGVGANVVCADIDTEAAQQSAKLIEADGGRAVPVSVDVSDPDSVAGMTPAVDSAVGTFAVLVNNAGIATRMCPVHEMAIADWDRVIAANLRGVFLCTRALLPPMMANGGGSIVNIASVSGWSAVPPDVARLSNYVASKAGVIGFTKAVAVEYAKDGIRANAIAPGWHPGGRLARESGLDDAEKAHHFSRIGELVPMGRVGRQEELRTLLLYLASDASSYMTGQVIAHDGGYTAW